MILFYEHGDGLYVNLTNRCPVRCSFCPKEDWDYGFEGQDLGLDKREPSGEELRSGLKEWMAKPKKHAQLVFCGFGEPTMRLTELLELAAFARQNWPELELRLNTVGLGDLIAGHDIVPELKAHLDMISVSLNTMDPAQWLTLHRPAPKYRAKGFEAVKGFIERAAKSGLRTRVTGVQGSGADLAPVEEFARRAGAEFLARPPLT